MSSATNTTTFNYLHVLALIRGALPNAPSGSGLFTYSSGPAANLAVYDSAASPPVTWLLNANLAATHQFSLANKTTTITGPGINTLTAPLISSGGTMLLATVTSWLTDLNNAHFAGANLAGAGKWELPAAADLQTLFGHLQLQTGDRKLLVKGNVGPFSHLQPFFYWSCMRDQSGSSQSPCNGSDAGTLNGNPKGIPMDFSFNFDSGFQGTDENSKHFYVMVYSPGPPPPQCIPPKCATPQQCCMQAGGYWNGKQCE